MRNDKDTVCKCTRARQKVSINAHITGDSRQLLASSRRVITHQNRLKTKDDRQLQLFVVHTVSQVVISKSAMSVIGHVTPEGLRWASQVSEESVHVDPRQLQVFANPCRSTPFPEKVAVGSSFVQCQILVWVQVEEFGASLRIRLNPRFRFSFIP